MWIESPWPENPANTDARTYGHTALCGRWFDHGMHCRWDLIRSKQQSSVSVCRAGFSGNGNSIHKNKEVCISVATSRGREITHFQEYHYKWRKMGVFIIMFNTKGNEVIRMNVRNRSEDRALWNEICALWDPHGIIHFEFLNGNQIFDTNLYNERTSNVMSAFSWSCVYIYIYIYFF